MKASVAQAFMPDGSSRVAIILLGDSDHTFYVTPENAMQLGQMIVEAARLVATGLVLPSSVDRPVPRAADGHPSTPDGTPAIGPVKP